MSGHAESQTKSALQHGFIVPERFHMPTLFTLIMFWWTFWMLALVFVPFLVYGDTDSPWVQGSWVTRISLAIIVSTGHGALGYMMGYLKGARFWHFLLGALLLPIGLVIIALLTNSKEAKIPERPTGLMKVCDRVAHACGNLWFGITQLVVMIAYLIRATVYETEISDKGNEAAYAAYYNSPLFGLIFLLFFLTIYAATMRKWPFRWQQTGWLMTHAGLMLLMVGCMIMYWGSFSGFARVLEGHTTTRVFDRDIRDIEVSVPALGYREKHRISIDRDPELKEVSQEIPIAFEHNGSQYKMDIKIDGHLSRAEFYTGIEPLPKEKVIPNRGQAGVAFNLSGMGMDRDMVVLEAENQGIMQFQNLDVRVRSFQRKHMITSIGHRYGPEDFQRGKVLVKRGGNVIAEVPVNLTAESGTGTAGRTIATPPTKLQNPKATVTVQRFFASMAPNDTGMMIDADPQNVRNPGVLVAIEGDNGRNDVYVTAMGQSAGGRDNAYGLTFEFHCRGEIPMPQGMVLFARHPDGMWSIALGSQAGTVHEPLEVGRAYRFSKAAPIQFKVSKFLERAQRLDTVRETEKRENFRAIHARISFEGDSDERWLINGLLRPQEFRLGGQRLTIQYASREVPLGFSLSCLDFRQENYANSQAKKKTYETNMVLRDPENEVEEAVLIDMNHPLAYQGYQFFNGSPVLNDATHERGIFLTVGRNPGYWWIIVASIITCTGIIVVFFFKKRIREWDARRRTAARKAEPAAA